MSITKMTLNRGLDADTDTLMVLERLAVGVTLNSNDAAEGVAAFLEKRTRSGPDTEPRAGSAPAAPG